MGFTFYSGPASNFPPSSQWKDFVTLFNINKPNMLQTGDSGPDVGAIFNGINQAAQQIGVEERVILCIIIQESGGNVGVQTTFDSGGVGDAGLMQAEGSPGFPGQHNLSQDQITSMILAGTNHYKQNLQARGDADDAPTIYEALRLYNSGSLDTSNLSNGLGATDSYVSDIANRLLGLTN